MLYTTKSNYFKSRFNILLSTLLLSNVNQFARKQRKPRRTRTITQKQNLELDILNKTYFDSHFRPFWFILTEIFWKKDIFRGRFRSLAMDWKLASCSLYAVIWPSKVKHLLHLNELISNLSNQKLAD